METVVNTHQAEAWNGYEGEHWATHQDRWDAVNADLTRHLLAGAAIGERERVLDIGCGNGQSTRRAAGLAAKGYAVGVDLSGPMLGRARATAAAERIGNVSFEQGDAQVYPFEPGGFDLAISRAGIMFFADPVAAFTNIGRALRSGGRFVFVCPRDVHLQEWFVAPMAALLGPGPVPAVPATPGEPGMFSLADRTYLDDVLHQAGFDTVTATEAGVEMRYGRDAEDAADFFLGMGPSRFLLGRSARTAADVRDTVVDALRPYETVDGVAMQGSFWLVHATRP